MKSLIQYFLIITQMWTLISCKQDEIEDVGTTSSFTYEDADHTNFVDPYSFDYDRANKRMADTGMSDLPRHNNDCASDGRCRLELKQCRDALNNMAPEGPFVKRMINLLLANAKFKEDGELLTSSITLSGTKDQIKRLQEYGDGKMTMRQVDVILTEVITSNIDVFSEALTLIDHLHVIIYQYKGISTALLTSFAILLSIKYVNWSTGRVILVFLGIIFFTSYIMIWSQLVKEAEIKRFTAARKYSGPPIQCEPEKMYFWQKIVTYFDEEDPCFAYYKAIEFDPFHEVTPLDALHEVTNRILFHPVGRLGSSIGDFIENSTKHLGYPMRWLITPMLYIGVVAAMVVLAATLVGGGLGFCFTPFFRMSIGKVQTNERQQQSPMIEERKPITVILQLDSDGGIKQSTSNAVTHSAQSSKLAIGDGDSTIQKKEVQKKSEESAATCRSCCCKEAKNNSHIEEDENAARESTSVNGRRNEKGGGDS